MKKKDLVNVWRDFGMPRGHAHAKALRTVKTCVGSEWCRFGTQDSTLMGKALERAMWRMYAPHEVKFAASGCPCNCAEAGIKDVGIVGVDPCWETRPPCTARWSAPSWWWCRRRFPPPPPRDVPTGCCRPPAGARRTAPSPTTNAASAGSAGGGAARQDAPRLGHRHRPGVPPGSAAAPGAAKLFPCGSAESVWNRHRESMRGRDLDITGPGYPMREAAGPQPWPLREGERHGQARLCLDHRVATPDGRARLFDTPDVALAEPRDARFPFSLTTGRLRAQGHGGSRTGTPAAGINALTSAACCPLSNQP